MCFTVKVPSVCNDVLVILEDTDQRSCVVSIKLGASAKFLYLHIKKCHISLPKMKTPASTHWREIDMIYWHSAKK